MHALTRFSPFAWKSLLSVFAIALIGSCQSPSVDTACSPRIHAAFDVGSGTTKLKVARVDPCAPKILKVLKTAQVKVDYKEDLDRSKDQKFSEAIQVSGLKAFEHLLTVSQNYHPDEQSAVATAAFREARNSEEFTKRILEQTGLNVRVISQSEEAHLGYFAAQAHRLSRGRPLFVWDIGGGSQQLTYRDPQGDFQVLRNQLGSVKFKNEVIEKLQKKPVSAVTSPNPLGADGYRIALQLARKQAAQLSPQLKDWIQIEMPLVVGIGGVHSQSVHRQTGAKGEYTQADLRSALKAKIHQSDAEIGGSYAATDVTNLILVLGFMEELRIDQVEASDVNLSDALLLNPKAGSL